MYGNIIETFFCIYDGKLLLRYVETAFWKFVETCGKGKLWKTSVKVQVLENAAVFVETFRRR